MIKFVAIALFSSLILSSCTPISRVLQTPVRVLQSAAGLFIP